MTFNRYGDICAEIYDIDKPFGRLPDTAFYLETLASVRGPILEPAVGTGRTLIPLLEAGHEVYGFDPSDEMLDRCRGRCLDRGLKAHLSKMRFEDFAYDMRFTAILVPVSSFTFVTEFDTALAVLRRFHNHLEQGGRLIIDLTLLGGLRSRGDDIRSWNAPDGDLLTAHGKRVETNYLAQTIVTHYRYERWRDNRLIDAQLELMRQRFWGANEFEMALAASGFDEVSIFGGYKRRPPREDDWFVTFEARRRA